MAYEPTRHDRTNLSRYGNNVGRYGNEIGSMNTGSGNVNAGNANTSGFGGGGWGQNGGEQIRDILHVIFKRIRLIILLFLAVALPGLIVTALQRPVYVASAKVMISTQRTDPTVQPTEETRLDQIRLNESLVNSEVHVVNSRELLEQVILDLARDDDGSIMPAKDNRTFGDQVLMLSKKLSVIPIKASNVIRIDYKSSDERAAARVVNRVVDEYLGYHAKVHGTEGLPRFYDEQRRKLARELQAAEDVLLRYTADTGLVAPEEEILVTVRQVSELSSILREVNMSISGLEERVRAVRDQIGQQPELVKQSQSLEVNPVITQLSAHVIDREVDRVALMRRYTEEDRLVRDNAEEISQLESRLEGERRDRPTIVTHELIRTNPVRQDLLRELLDREARLREQRARQVTLQEESDRINRRMVSLRQSSVDFRRLEQEVKQRREMYELYVKREQEARVSQAMDERKLVNVDVVQRPGLPLPRADSQGVTRTLSLIAGLLVGIAGAFGREYITRSLRSEYDVTRHLGLPLLASIGEIPKK
jgi:uncharacterized protein involved in exopolysaccharide biosynthesis